MFARLFEAFFSVCEFPSTFGAIYTAQQCDFYVLMMDFFFSSRSGRDLKDSDKRPFVEFAENLRLNHKTEHPGTR